MRISISDIRPGMYLIYNQELFIVLSCEHTKLGRGSAFCRTKLKNIKNARIIDSTLRDSDNIEEAFLEKRQLQYIYREGELLRFLDLETYEDFVLPSSQVEAYLGWFKDNLELTGLFYNNELVSLEFPKVVELKVIETQPGVKGDTVKMPTKSAKLETGITVDVPLFINEGELIRVDTETGKYIGRA